MNQTCESEATPGREAPAALDPLPLLAAFVWFLATIQILALALSLAQVVLSQPLALGVLGVSVVAGAATSVRMRGQPVAPPAAPALPALVPNWLLGVLLVAAGAFILLAFGVATQRPDVSFDGNLYHIPPISYWARTGYVHWIRVESMPVHVAKMVNGYPKGIELVAFVVARAFHTSRLIPTVTFWFLPLGVLGIAQLAHALGARRLVAYASGLLLALVPTVVSQSATTYTDASYACCVTALFALACSRGLLRTLSAIWVATVGAAAGLVLSGKGSGVLPVATAFAFLGILELSRALRQPGRRWRGTARTALAFGAAAVIALAVAGYWYARNYVREGSPLYPVGVRIGSRQVFPGCTVSEAIAAYWNTPPELRPLSPAARVAYTWLQALPRTLTPERRLGWPRSILGVDSRTGGLGFLWLLACVPAIVAVVAGLAYQRSRGVRNAALGVFAALAVLTGLNFALTPMNWWPRYTLWIYTLGLPALARVVEYSAARAAGRALLRVWLAGCVAIVLFEGCLTLRSVVRRSDDVRAPLNHPKVQARLARLEPVALLTKPDDFQELAGPLLLPIGARYVTYVRPEEAAAADARLLERLRRLDVRYVICQRGLPLSAELRSAVRATIPSGPLDLLDLKGDGPP